jgi:acetylornithine deacetylase/succinyl-diaminopimelate desuccinylase-like protein
MSWQTYLNDNRSRFINELIEFVSIPSISALPQHKSDVRHAAEWLSARLNTAGMQHAGLIETEGHPAVYADWLHAPGKPTVLLYGHYDVQPVDPLDQWITPPFEPSIRDGKIYGRGASDDKGNIIATVQTLEAILRTRGKFQVNIKCIFEGEEEIGSPTLGHAIAQHRDALSCDHIFSMDGLQWSEHDAGILVGLKGMAKLQINVYGPKTDQHSGLFGATIQNPAMALAHILASLRSPEGKVLVEGFYDNVRPLTDQDREHLAVVPFDASAIQKVVEVTDLTGEPGYSPIERMWARPTLDVNGIWGGFQGAGSKTIIPAEAHAKITCRLVADQDPARIADLIELHIRRNTPPGVRVEVEKGTSGAYPFLMAPDHPSNVLVQGVLSELYGKDPFYVRVGGSVPVYAVFERELGVQPATMGFTLEDEQLHAPNEFWRLESFDRCQLAYGMLLHEF